MQTEADQVMHALAGWPQCWACLDYQKPHRMRMAAMRKHNTDTCLCTPCRKTEVRCTRCCDTRERWAMLWRQESSALGPWQGAGPDYAFHGTWRGCCTSCARSQHTSDRAAFRTYTQFYSYPAGTPADVPRKRHVPYRRRSVTKRP